MNLRLGIIAAILALSGISQTTFASSESAPATDFSPYADITINTHWDNQTQDMEPTDLSLISQASGVKSYHLAFITDAGTCTPAWGGQASYSINAKWGQHLTTKLHTNSIHSIISFGGATGNDLSMACSESQLVDVIDTVVKTYQPDGLDFDIENGTADVTKTMHALQKIQHTYPTLSLSFTLPVLPEGLTPAGKDVVNHAKLAGLDYAVNIMAMDYGPSYTNDMGQYAIQAGTSLFTFLKSLYPEKPESAIWRMVEITPMIGVNDVNSEQFTLKNVDTLRNFSQQVHLNRLAMWSVARDTPCADKWASPVCSGNNLQATPHEYATRFIVN